MMAGASPTFALIMPDVRDFEGTLMTTPHSGHRITISGVDTGLCETIGGGSMYFCKSPKGKISILNPSGDIVGEAPLEVVIVSIGLDEDGETPKIYYKFRATWNGVLDGRRFQTMAWLSVSPQNSDKSILLGSFSFKDLGQIFGVVGAWK